MMSSNRNIALVAGAGVLLLAIGIGGGYRLGRGHAPAAAPGAHPPSPGGTAATDGSGREVLYWYDPMYPDQRFDKPGPSPFMDMALVPKYADEGGGDAAAVRIAPGVRQNLGIRTAAVELGRLAGQVRVPGTLAWDLRHEEVVSVPVQAIVSRLHVRAPYERVEAGVPLAAVLAPEWSAAIAETRALAGADSADARELQSAARQRLRVLGLSDTTAAAGGAVVLRAPRPGVVSEVLVREGATVMPGTPLFRINGTSTLWLEAAIPQAVAGDIEPGTPVTATVDAVPGRTFEGRVETLLADVDEATRARRARIVLRNEDGLLAPGMFAEVTLSPGAREAVPLVPTEAIIATGVGTRVFVTDPDGGFRPMPVRTGRSAGGRTEILAGLQGGERVVVSGQFLIDSEANLSGALDRLSPPAEGRTTPRADTGNAPAPLPERGR